MEIKHRNVECWLFFSAHIKTKLLPIPYFWLLVISTLLNVTQLNSAILTGLDWIISKMSNKIPIKRTHFKNLTFNHIIKANKTENTIFRCFRRIIQMEWNTIFPAPKRFVLSEMFTCIPGNKKNPSSTMMCCFLTYIWTITNSRLFGHVIFTVNTNDADYKGFITKIINEH